MCTSTPKPRTGRILGYMAQKRIRPQPPTFYGFEASDSPNEKNKPPYQWSPGAAGGPASPRTVRANRGSTRVPRAKKMIFSKAVPRPLEMLKQVFLGCFEAVVARFGPCKIPTCLENEPFWDQKWVKNRSKTRFSKSDPGPFMMLKQVVLAHFEPVATGFGSWRLPKCLENGPFPKVIPDHLELVYGNTRQAMCMLHTRRGQTSMLIPVSLKSFRTVAFLSFDFAFEHGWNTYVYYLCVSRHFLHYT